MIMFITPARCFCFQYYNHVILKYIKEIIIHMLFNTLFPCYFKSVVPKDMIDNHKNGIENTFYLNATLVLHRKPNKK